MKKFNSDLVNISEEELDILLDMDNYQIKLDEEVEKINKESLSDKANLELNEEKKEKNEKNIINNDKNKAALEKRELKKDNILEMKKIENILVWFSYENILQIIEIDPFNILSITNIDFYAFQEYMFFDNTLFLKENSSNFNNNANDINKKLAPSGYYNKNCIFKEYVLDKENKFLILLKANYTSQKNNNLLSSNADTNNNNNKEKLKADKSTLKNLNSTLENKGKQIEKKPVKKEGKFITELKTINEKDELYREEQDLKFNILKNNLELIISQFINIDKYNTALDRKLIDKSYLFLGEDENNA